MKYSDKLTRETIKVFKEEDGLDISEETAEEYLNGLSGLFLAFSKPNQTKTIITLNTNFS
ncbi:MAG: hypothetical protein WAX85_00305 [Minisyncoccia bacterium]